VEQRLHALQRGTTGVPADGATAQGSGRVGEGEGVAHALPLEQGEQKSAVEDVAGSRAVGHVDVKRRGDDEPPILGQPRTALLSHGDGHGARSGVPGPRQGPGQIMLTRQGVKLAARGDTDILEEFAKRLLGE
jgi:hypothetical protein